MPAVCQSPPALDFLLRRINYERTTSVPYQSADFKLDRMRRLMHLLGDPQDAVKAIHIAGTKGKGSTAAMIAAVLQAAGYQTGLYTSPHLDRIEERIVIDGQPCPTGSFLKLAAQVQPFVEQLDREAEANGATGPTFFEVTTAMAFLHFAQENVAAAVLEVGLGGRLDSTNICRPEVCIITSISFDHTKQLGSTLAQIAAEKAGIIKPGIPVISGVANAEPKGVITSRATALGAPLFQRGIDYDFESLSLSPPPPLSPSKSTPGSALNYRERATTPTYQLRDLELFMLGSHQAANAADAIAAVRRLTDRGWQISEDAVRTGLATAQVSARIEQLQSSPTIILDVAHNLASIEALLAVLRENFTPRRRILIFASSKDKDYTGMLKLVLPAFDVIFLTQYINNPRAVETGELLTIAQQLRNALPLPLGEGRGEDLSFGANDSLHPTLHACVRPTEALRLARAIAQPNDLICIAGSFFLAAELRPLL
ncbi:MAG TPA: folylpolyglutamate synthase/dihydrofolate synthase family protein [Pirellulaceae bacterium]|jgi:dihydrofolate synthase/folylpolyglutamate synthase